MAGWSLSSRWSSSSMIIIMVEVSLYLLLCHSVALTQSKSLQFRATSPPVKIHIHTCEDLLHHHRWRSIYIHVKIFIIILFQISNQYIPFYIQHWKIEVRTFWFVSPVRSFHLSQKISTIGRKSGYLPSFDNLTRIWFMNKHIFCLFGSFSVVLYRLSAKMHPIYQVNTDLVQSALHLVELQSAIATHSGGFLPQVDIYQPGQPLAQERLWKGVAN